MNHAKENWYNQAAMHFDKFVSIVNGSGESQFDQDLTTYFT